MRTNDMIVGRTGDSITGTVLDKAFDIATVFGNIPVRTKDITWVHVMNLPQFRQDEIWLTNDDRLSGKIKQDRVIFKLEDGRTLEIPREAIHTIIINQAWDVGGKKLS
ncbi:MAG: hypothetical protein NTX17_07680 [Candidatus Eisenbacteria bacterium]|nr:hypothetical protein [Candidatus Eisenbacteria bacterium]